MTKKQPKAQRLFNHSFYAALSHIEVWGMKSFGAWSSLHDGTDEVICRRTVNAILKECDKRERSIALDRRLGLIAEAEASKLHKAVEVVRNTCAGWIRKDEEWKDYLKSLTA